MKYPTKAKLAALFTALLTVPVFAMAVSSAVGEGQIERGDIYYSRNITKGGAFGDPTAADKCDSLQYKVRLHNPGASPVTNVNIKVNLPAGASMQNVSTATITAQNAFPATVSDTATVNISSSETISYVSGSTQLLDASNNVISSLPDGITGGGVNVGSVGVSINEIRFVQFKANISCPQTPPPVTPPPVTPPPTTPPVTPPTQSQTQSQSQSQTQITKVQQAPAASTPVAVSTSPAPTELVNTGPGQIVAVFTGAVIAGSLAYRFFLVRRLN